MKASIVQKSDINRILLSETSPEDVPVIFSNKWFYQHMNEYHHDKNHSDDFKRKTIEAIFICRDEDRDFVPLKYSILKPNGGLRHLGILHPASQNQMVEFYKEFDKRIINYTTKSLFTLRSPCKVATKSYYDEKLTNDDDKPPTTYFAYRYTRLSGFFGSKEFLSLERKYNKFWSLDISRFFESIYTHSISWAVKGKGFAKETRSSSDFAGLFDRLMQRSNFNETNGIIIGNEVSRVFAEIILQAVDIELLETLNKLNLKVGIDYDIKRYVDDYFVFSTDDATLEIITSALESLLRFYKLHFNENKTIKNERPFITGVTRAKIQTEDAISWLFKTIFEIKNEKLSKLRKPNQVKRKFIDKVMAGSFQDNKAYSVMCGYVISALHNKLLDIIESNELNKSDYVDVKNSLLVLLEIAFHLFNVSPTSNNSVKLCSICKLLHDMYSKNYPDEIDSIILSISSFIKQFFESSVIKERAHLTDFSVPIEFANLLCISSSMGSEYLLSPKIIKDIFCLNSLKARAEDYIDKEDCTDYFNIVSALFYIKQHPEYNRIRSDVIKEANKRLHRLDRIRFDARICFLFLDCMSCPYIDIKSKTNWAKKAEKVLFGKELAPKESESFLEQLVNNKWFVCWSDEIVLDELSQKNTLLFGY